MANAVTWLVGAKSAKSCDLNNVTILRLGDHGGRNGTYIQKTSVKIETLPASVPVVRRYLLHQAGGRSPKLGAALHAKTAACVASPTTELSIADQPFQFSFMC